MSCCSVKHVTILGDTVMLPEIMTMHHDMAAKSPMYSWPSSHAIQQPEP